MGELLLVNSEMWSCWACKESIRSFGAECPPGTGQGAGTGLSKRYHYRVCEKWDHFPQTCCAPMAVLCMWSPTQGLSAVGAEGQEEGFAWCHIKHGVIGTSCSAGVDVELFSPH